MSGRVCARGCTVREKHYAGCSGDPASAEYRGDRCSGCLPALAEHGGLLCSRCLQRIRRTLEDAPDLAAHLRALIDPMKAQVFDRDKLSGGKIPFSPAPVNVDLIDAEAEVFDTLSWWAAYFGDSTEYGPLGAGAEPEEVFAAANWAAQYLLFNMERIANDALVVSFSKRVIDMPEESDGWTIRKALERFPLNARAHWAKRPCPSCRLKSVWVVPPQRAGQSTSYECKGCGWVPPVEERSLWEIYFEGVV